VNGNREHASLEPLVAPTILDLSLCPFALAARDLPRLAYAACGIPQLVVFGQAQQETQGSVETEAYPGTARKAPVENV